MIQRNFEQRHTELVNQDLEDDRLHVDHKSARSILTEKLANCESSLGSHIMNIEQCIISEAEEREHLGPCPRHHLGPTLNSNPASPPAAPARQPPPHTPTHPAPAALSLRCPGPLAFQHQPLQPARPGLPRSRARPGVLVFARLPDAPQAAS